MKSATVLDHTVDRLLLPGILTGPLPEHSRVYLELLGAKYIPVFKDGNMHYVLSHHASTLCEKYGLILGKKTQPLSAAAMSLTFDGIHIEDFYYTISPYHMVVFGLHGIKFIQVEYNEVKIWVYDKATESVCKRFATSTNPHRVQSVSILVRTHSVRLPEYSTELSDLTRMYYELLAVDFVTVRNGTAVYYIPVKYLDLVCDRLNLYN